MIPYTIVYLYLIPYSYVQIHGELVYRSNICIKESPTNRIPIYDQAAGFRDLVENSNVFVDKTLLIKALLEDSNTAIYITCPRKWGKRINLDMLKTFVEIETDTKGNAVPLESTWSYRFFTKGEVMGKNDSIERLKNPPLIAEHKNVVKKNLCKFPVLYFDFTRLVPEENTYVGFVQAFRNSMREIYKKYSFVKDKLAALPKTDAAMLHIYMAQIHLRAFEQYELGKPQVEGLQNGFKLLSELLHSHYRKRVFVLINQPEYPFHQNSFPSNEEKLIQVFCAGFVDLSVSSNTHLTKAIVTGVLESSEEDEDYQPEDSRHAIRMYNMISNPMYEFYGFTLNEVEMLSAHLNIPTNLTRKARNRYHGYRTCYDSYTIIFNTWSMVNFVNTHRVENYWWRSTCSDQFLCKLFKFPEIRKLFKSVIDGKYTSIHHNDTRFTLEDVAMIKKLIRGEHLKLDTQLESLLLSYFYASGYLTMTNDVTHFMDQPVIPFVELRIANEEIKDGIVAQLKRNEEIKSITNVNLESCLHNFTNTVKYPPLWI